MPVADNGPYENERAACAAARAVIPPDPGRVILSQSQRYELMQRAFTAAGVSTSAFEETSAWWLANYEDYLSAMIAGWVTRAFEAGKAAGPDGAETEWSLNIAGAAGLVPYEEETARRIVQMMRENGVRVELYGRQVGPWTPADEPATRDEREKGDGGK